MAGTSASQPLDFPKFDGSGPFYWLFRAEQFFAYSGTPEAQRLAIAAASMEGSVVSWFQMMQTQQAFTSWSDLAKLVEDHFVWSRLDRVFGAPSPVEELVAERDTEKFYVDADNDDDEVQETTIAASHISVLAGVETEKLDNANDDAVGILGTTATRSADFIGTDDRVSILHDQFKPESEPQTQIEDEDSKEFEDEELRCSMPCLLPFEMVVPSILVEKARLTETKIPLPDCYVSLLHPVRFLPFALTSPMIKFLHNLFSLGTVKRASWIPIDWEIETRIHDPGGFTILVYFSRFADFQSYFKDSITVNKCCNVRPHLEEQLCSKTINGLYLQASDSIGHSLISHNFIVAWKEFGLNDLIDMTFRTFSSLNVSKWKFTDMASHIVLRMNGGEGSGVMAFWEGIQVDGSLQHYSLLFAGSFSLHTTIYKNVCAIIAYQFDPNARVLPKMHVCYCYFYSQLENLDHGFSTLIFSVKEGQWNFYNDKFTPKHLLEATLEEFLVKNANEFSTIEMSNMDGMIINISVNSGTTMTILAKMQECGKEGTEYLSKFNVIHEGTFHLGLLHGLAVRARLLLYQDKFCVTHDDDLKYAILACYHGLHFFGPIVKLMNMGDKPSSITFPFDPGGCVIINVSLSCNALSIIEVHYSMVINLVKPHNFSKKLRLFAALEPLILLACVIIIINVYCGVDFSYFRSHPSYNFLVPRLAFALGSSTYYSIARHCRCERNNPYAKLILNLEDKVGLNMGVIDTNQAKGYANDMMKNKRLSDIVNHKSHFHITKMKLLKIMDMSFESSRNFHVKRRRVIFPFDPGGTMFHGQLHNKMKLLACCRFSLLATFVYTATAYLF